MAFVADPHRDWETDWEIHNPEPHVEGPWSFPKTMERIAWHRKRYEAYLEWCRSCNLKPR